MGTTNGYDWEAIFKDIRTNVISLREVSRKHKVDYAYMRRQAKKHGIERDLSTRVKEEVNKQIVTTAVSSGDLKRDENAVKEAAAQVVQVVEIHRKDIQKLREQEAEILIDLASGEKPVWKRKIVSVEGQPDEEIIQIDRVPMTPIEKAITLNNLTNVQNRRVQLERQAYNLNDLASVIDDYHVVETINPANAVFTMKVIEEKADG